METILTTILVLSVVWGGFIVTLLFAMIRERNKVEKTDQISGRSGEGS